MAEDNADSFTKWKKDTGWRRSIPSWIWNSIALDKPPFIGWEIDQDGNPWFVMLEHERGPEESDVESYAMRKEFDDVSQGLFYQRDWTSSGLPLVSEKTIYWSGWWFQFREDAERFQETYGGIGSWQNGYKEWEAQCRGKRNSPMDSSQWALVASK